MDCGTLIAWKSGGNGCLPGNRRTLSSSERELGTMCTGQTGPAFVVCIIYVHLRFNFLHVIVSVSLSVGRGIKKLEDRPKNIVCSGLKIIFFLIS